MNKYIKLFALSSGLLGALVPSAIDLDNDMQNKLSQIYESVDDMEELNSSTSRLNYEIDVNSNDKNVTFSTTNEDGSQTDLTEQETINYLNSTLEQVNSEYEELKQTLINAIQDTMDYLDKYEEQELTNEQKLYIKEHSNSIKFLANTLENLSSDVIKTIDGCENCDDFEKVAGIYMLTINNLEEKIEALQNSLTSLNMINSLSSPYYNRTAHHFPNGVVYGFRFGTNPSLNNTEQNQDSQLENENNEQENSTNQNELENNQENENQENNSQDNNTNSNTEQQTLNDSSTDLDSTEEEKPTTFGLKSNIDSYAPTKRNIDTFFNTALLGNEYNMYGGMPNMYGMPYGNAGYGNMYGYGFGNPYNGGGLNSNNINKEVLENHNNSNNVNSISNIEAEPKQDVQKPKKVRAKKAKNVDSYKGVTVKSNINTMGESKIAKFFKEKFNNMRNKIKNQKNDNAESSQDLTKNLPEHPVTQQTNIENNENSINNAENVKEDLINSENTAEIKKEELIKAR